MVSMCLIKFELWEELVAKELHLKGCYYLIVHIMKSAQVDLDYFLFYEDLMNVSLKSMT